MATFLEKRSTFSDEFFILFDIKNCFEIPNCVLGSHFYFSYILVFELTVVVLVTSQFGFWGGGS